MNEILPHYKEARAAFERICAITLDETSRDCLLNLINFTLSSRRRIVLYLGSGCSLQVSADSVAMHDDYQPVQWLDLLKRVFRKAPEAVRKKFVQAISESLKKDVTNIDDLLPRFDRLQLAWFLTKCYDSPADRDARIREIVEPAEGAKRHSPFFEALLDLPFSDIITTNYDTNISYFLGQRTDEPPQEVASTEELRANLDGRRGRRIFYLHGIVGRGKLVFDRFDYARLLEEREGLRDYVTFVMRGSHVIYLGFSLEDLSFNLLDEHLQMVSEEKRPECFAFLPKVTSLERDRWKERHLNIVEYKDHTQLPQLIESMNIIRRFINWAEPKNLDAANPAKVDDDRMSRYIQDSLKAYVIGNFEKSLADSRAALATTLFWRRDLVTGLLESDTFERTGKFVECRVRMALNHHKLRWINRQGVQREPLPDTHIRDAHENLESAQEMLDRLTMANLPVHEERSVRILQHSINSLKGRLLYHQGRYVDALALYDDILRDEPNAMLLKDRANMNPNFLWELKLAEGYYYAKCQKARITYQLRDTRQAEEKEGWAAGKNRITAELGSLALDLELIWRSLDQYPTQSAELDYYRTSLRHIWEIMLWTAGRYQTAVCEDVLPTASERNNESKLKALNNAIEALNKIARLRQGEEIIPPRWNAMRYRYLSRAHGLRWLLVETQFGESGQRVNEYMGDLITAHSALRNAFQQTRGPGLERQHIINLLEGARLTLMECFGERLQGRTPFAYSSPSMAACAHFLDHALERILQLEGEGADLKILALRIAAYFSVVARPWFEFNEKQVRTPILREFWAEKAVMERVLTEYQEFEAVMGQGNPLETRIKNFVNSFRAIDSELSTKEGESYQDC